jgi:multidrug efflux system membrane fusion protein
MTGRVLFLPLLALAAAPACAGSGQEAAAARPGRDTAVPVTVGRVVEKPMPLELRVIGTAEANSSVAVRAQVSGQLTGVNFEEGEEVRQGQVLFEIDRRPLEASLRQAEAALERDLAQEANASAQLRRYEDLLERGISTREQVETARATTSALRATAEADRAAIDSARLQLEFATIEAPIAGLTGALMVHAGNVVRANDTAPLVVINQVSPIYVSFAVPEAQLPALRQYLARGTVDVHAQGPNEKGPPALGRITFVDNGVDQTTGTIRVKASFPNLDRRFWPGQYLNVTVRLATDPTALVVPATAVQTGQDGTFVFVVAGEQAELRRVEVARANAAEAVIASGVKAGETVVVDGQLRLVQGSRVSIKPAAERQAP